MPRSITENLTGRVYRKWTVLGPTQIATPSGGSHTHWLCRCSCGTESVLSRNQLVRGKSGGCRNCQEYPGCRKYETPTEAAWYARYNMYRRNAEVVDRVFGLTFDEFKKLSELPCYYCGTDPEPRRIGSRDYYPVIHGSGIDRVDSTVGYIPSNCVPCCTRCNHAKGTLSQSDFLQMCTAVAAIHRGAH